MAEEGREKARFWAVKPGNEVMQATGSFVHLDRCDVFGRDKDVRKLLCASGSPQRVPGRLLCFQELES